MANPFKANPITMCSAMQDFVGKGRSKAVRMRSRGFTLLEVMISLAVVGGLLITLIYTLNYHLSILERHEIVTVASFLAKDKIAETEKSLKEEKGAFPEPYASYSYETTIRESSYPGILEVSVVVGRDKERVSFLKMIRSSKGKV